MEISEYGRFTGANDSNEATEEELELERQRRAVFAEARKKSIERKEGSLSAMIPISLIDDSPYNKVREIDPERVKAIADSIKRVGLINPLVVFKNGERYTIYGGHVRKAAWLYLMKTDPTWIGKIPCRILPAPTGSDSKERARSEMEIQSQAEIHRFKKSDIEIEIVRANDLWTNYISEDEKQKLREEYLQMFKTRNENNPRYQADPEKYIVQNFRPRFEYIRLMTGIEENSDRTIRRILAGNEKQPVEKKEKVIKKITPKKFAKKLNPYRAYLQEFLDQDNVDTYLKQKTEEILILISEIQDHVSSER